MLVFIALLDDIPVMISHTIVPEGKPTTKMGYVSSSRNGTFLGILGGCIFSLIILYW